MMAAHKKVLVVPHAGGVGLCELVRQYSFIDYVCFTGTMKDNLCESTDHLHEFFEEPIEYKNRPGDNILCYMPNKTPGFATMNHSKEKPDLYDWAFPFGPKWSDKNVIGEELDKWASKCRADDIARAKAVLEEGGSKGDSGEWNSLYVFAAGLAVGAATIFAYNTL